jgi:hypothetical protein
MLLLHITHLLTQKRAIERMLYRLACLLSEKCVVSRMCLPCSPRYASGRKTFPKLKGAETYECLLCRAVDSYP